MYLPLPKSVKDEIAIKLSNGIPAERIMEGTHCSPYSIYSQTFTLMITTACVYVCVCCSYVCIHTVHTHM